MPANDAVEKKNAAMPVAHSARDRVNPKPTEMNQTRAVAAAPRSAFNKMTDQCEPLTEKNRARSRG